MWWRDTRFPGQAAALGVGFPPPAGACPRTARSGALSDGLRPRSDDLGPGKTIREPGSSVSTRGIAVGPRGIVQGAPRTPSRHPPARPQLTNPLRQLGLGLGHARREEKPEAFRARPARYARGCPRWTANGTAWCPHGRQRGRVGATESSDGWTACRHTRPGVRLVDTWTARAQHRANIEAARALVGRDSPRRCH